jgi:hypothetical protein
VPVVEAPPNGRLIGEHALGIRIGRIGGEVVGVVLGSRLGGGGLSQSGVRERQDQQGERCGCRAAPTVPPSQAAWHSLDDLQGGMHPAPRTRRAPKGGKPSISENGRGSKFFQAAGRRLDRVAQVVAARSRVAQPVVVFRAHPSRLAGRKPAGEAARPRSLAYCAVLGDGRRWARRPPALGGHRLGWAVCLLFGQAIRRKMWPGGPGAARSCRTTL